MITSITSLAIQKARKSALRKRVLYVCKRCRHLKIKCNDAKPCKACRFTSNVCIPLNYSVEFLNNEWVIPPTSWIINSFFLNV